MVEERDKLEIDEASGKYEIYKCFHTLYFIFLFIASQEKTNGMVKEWNSSV